MKKGRDWSCRKTIQIYPQVSVNFLLMRPINLVSNDIYSVNLCQYRTSSMIARPSLVGVTD